MTAANANDRPLRILTAEWIAPMTPTVPKPVAGYGVVIGYGEIKAVGPLGELKASTPSTVVEDLGDVILMPGLVNVHVHLELSDAVAGDPPAGGFGDWLLGVIRHTAKAGPCFPSRSGPRSNGACGSALDLASRVSATSVVSAPSPAPSSATDRSALRATAKSRRWANAVTCSTNGWGPRDESQRTGRLEIGITPHAPYTVEPQFYTACEVAAHSRGLPLATHLSESPDEATFLAEHRGPFRELWEAIGAGTMPCPASPVDRSDSRNPSACSTTRRCSRTSITATTKS